MATEDTGIRVLSLTSRWCGWFVFGGWVYWPQWDLHLDFCAGTGRRFNRENAAHITRPLTHAQQPKSPLFFPVQTPIRVEAHPIVLDHQPNEEPHSDQG